MNIPWLMLLCLHSVCRSIEMYSTPIQNGWSTTVTPTFIFWEYISNLSQWCRRIPKPLQRLNIKTKCPMFVFLAIWYVITMFLVYRTTSGIHIRYNYCYLENIKKPFSSLCCFCLWCKTNLFPGIRLVSHCSLSTIYICGCFCL